MTPFTLLIKPASADCNLRCKYCFYLDRAGLYPETKRHVMPDTVLQAMIKGYLETPQPQYAFAWQGGEPTLLGIHFFRRVIEFQKRYGRPGSSVCNHLQTNGLRITEAFAAFLHEYNFLTGVSLDGPAEIHDRYRCYPDGRGSHADVLKALNILRRHRVKFNILTLVTQANVGHPRRVYRYLRNQGIAHHQYIPCTEFDREGRRLPFALEPEEWGDFLCAVFDEWIASDIGVVSVRLFDSLIHYFCTGQPNVCHMGRDCRQYFVVEHNGDVYPCDFFVEPAWKLGNIQKDSWADLQHSTCYEKFGRQKRNWHSDCAACEHLDYCAGDCLKQRLEYGRKTPSQKSWLCRGYKKFFDHAVPRLKVLASEFKNQMHASDTETINRPAPSKVGRNEPCPCGSGRKFKHCCGR